MQHELKKVTLIINELITLMLQNGAEEIDMKIKRKEHTTEVILVNHMCDYSKEFIDKLRYNLKTQRQSEIEGYYWQLLGEDDVVEEIHLVGAMIDEASVEMHQKDLHIHIIRQEQCH